MENKNEASMISKPKGTYSVHSPCHGYMTYFLEGVTQTLVI